MGRVHKKKLAEYAEAAENDDQRKSVGGSDGEEEEDESKNAKTVGDLRYSGDSDVEEVDNANDSKNDSKEDQAVDEGNEGNDDEASKSAGEEKDGESVEKNGTGKKASKRKANQNAAKKVAEVEQDGDDSDDEPINGGGGAKRGRKSATTAKGKGKTAKAVGGRGKGKAAKKVAAVAEENEGDDGDEDEEYEVQEIIKHKVERGQTLYLIRWKGYTKDDDTWEPEDTLSCPDIIKKYKEKTGGNKGSAKKTASPAKKGPKVGGAAAKALKADPSKEWEVDKIIDYAVEKTGRVFRIRWKGFSPKYDTWEPEKNLYCDDLIEKFMEKMNSQENISFKELREEPKKTKRLVNETSPRTNYRNPVGRKSKRSVTKKRVYYGGDSDE